ncbi:hypothetical protein SCLO_1022950 [Sphingobium cloacae]|uniref:Uncharacterized protein n=1 Tax=Sphingobium cloacae TaxID=120107 RepID=A0A1E1F490_9SPHN|nr:hypothetical protein SCLO_1022950 [Sphingobium cloacae]
MLAGALLLAAPTANAEPSLAPWGARSGETLAIDSARGPWARRWVGRNDVGAVMLTVYRSAQDAQKVAMFSRGLSDGPEHDNDLAFLRGYLPHTWQTRVLAIEATAYNSEARGLCAIVGTGEKPLRLCMASRPDSAAVATMMTPLDRDTATEAAMLLARYAARHPLHVAG